MRKSSDRQRATGKPTPRSRQSPISRCTRTVSARSVSYTHLDVYKRQVRDGLKQQKNAKAQAAYRQKHESDFIIADAAPRYFRENGISKLPSCKALQAEIEVFIKEKNSGYNDYRAKREEYRRLQTVKDEGYIPEG